MDLRYIHRLINGITIFLTVMPFISFAQPISNRLYKEGEIYKYMLTTEVYRNNVFSDKTISISEHRVFRDTGFFSEEIKWLHATFISATDTLLMDSIAQRVKSYAISLSPKGRVLLPKLSEPRMIGAITDLNTFYVAAAPPLNARKLSPKNPLIKNDELRRGNFADGIEMVYGVDCFQVTQKLISSNKKYSTVETVFTPPSQICIIPLIDTIAKKTFGELNNVEFVRKSAGDKVNLFWGVETFAITLKISNKNGQIIEGSMINLLNLRMRFNASTDYTTYQVEVPVTIRRSLKLQLMK